MKKESKKKIVKNIGMFFCLSGTIFTIVGVIALFAEGYSSGITNLLNGIIQFFSGVSIIISAEEIYGD